MKIWVFIVLFSLFTGIFCPSQITINTTDSSPSLFSLNVCDVGGSALSVDSKIPVIHVPHTGGLVLSQSEMTFREYEQFYKFIFITDLIKPPCV